MSFDDLPKVKVRKWNKTLWGTNHARALAHARWLRNESGLAGKVRVCKAVQWRVEWTLKKKDGA